MVELLCYSIYLSSIPVLLLLLSNQVLTGRDRLHVPDPLCSQNNKATYNPIPSRTLCPIWTQNRRTPSSEAGCYRRTLSILSTLWSWRQSSATRTFSIQTSTYGKGQRLGTSLPSRILRQSSQSTTFYTLASLPVIKSRSKAIIFRWLYSIQRHYFQPLWTTKQSSRLQHR